MVLCHLVKTICWISCPSNTYRTSTVPLPSLLSTVYMNVISIRRPRLVTVCRTTLYTCSGDVGILRQQHPFGRDNRRELLELLHEQVAHGVVPLCLLNTAFFWCHVITKSINMLQVPRLTQHYRASLLSRSSHFR
jgi:hypothetical protein